MEDDNCHHGSTRINPCKLFSSKMMDQKQQPDVAEAVAIIATSTQ